MSRRAAEPDASFNCPVVWAMLSGKSAGGQSSRRVGGVASAGLDRSPPTFSCAGAELVTASERAENEGSPTPLYLEARRLKDEEQAAAPAMN